jgi:6-phosphogluconolactonase
MLNAAIRDFEGSEIAANLLAGADALRHALSSRSHAHLALSGERTPKLFLEHFAQQGLNWYRVWVTLAGERCYVNTHPKSNAHLVKETLLTSRTAEASFFLFTQNSTSSHDQKLDAFLKDGFDSAILVIGPDGHAASFFLDADCLDELLDLKREPKIRLVHAVSAGEPRLATFSSSDLIRSKACFCS